MIDYLFQKIYTSRRILKGSVAIGGAQTGIYPDSPGGWYVIGKTPLIYSILQILINL